MKQDYFNMETQEVGVKIAEGKKHISQKEALAKISRIIDNREKEYFPKRVIKGQNPGCSPKLGISQGIGANRDRRASRDGSRIVDIRILE